MTTIFQLFPSSCPPVTLASSYRLTWLRAPLIYARLCGWFKAKQTCGLDSSFSTSSLRKGRSPSGRFVAPRSTRAPKQNPETGEWKEEVKAEAGAVSAGAESQGDAQSACVVASAWLENRSFVASCWRQAGKARVAKRCNPPFVSGWSGGLVL